MISNHKQTKGFKTHPSTATRHLLFRIRRRKEAFSLSDSDRALNCIFPQSQIKLNHANFLKTKTFNN